MSEALKRGRELLEKYNFTWPTTEAERLIAEEAPIVLTALCDELDRLEIDAAGDKAKIEVYEQMQMAFEKTDAKLTEAEAKNKELALQSLSDSGQYMAREAKLREALEWIVKVQAPGQKYQPTKTYEIAKQALTKEKG